MIVLLAGTENRGLLSGLFRLIYEDMSSFDNGVVSVVKVSFNIQVPSTGENSQAADDLGNLGPAKGSSEAQSRFF